MPHITPINAFEDNYIWMIRADPEGREAVVVDPGDEEPVIEALERGGLQLAAILVTHHHHDHTGGIRSLVERDHVPVYGPANESVTGCDRPLRDGDSVELFDGRLTLGVMELPGHTRGHLAYYGGGLLFSGDTLFAAGCGRLFEGTASQMQHSLSRLRALPPETALYCAHEYTVANLGFATVAEPDNRQIRERLERVRAARASNHPSLPSTLAEELATNPFLRYDQPALIAAAERFAGRPLNGATEVFATVRHWKDTLD